MNSRETTCANSHINFFILSSKYSSCIELLVRNIRTQRPCTYTPMSISAALRALPYSLKTRVHTVMCAKLLSTGRTSLCRFFEQKQLAALVRCSGAKNPPPTNAIIKSVVFQFDRSIFVAFNKGNSGPAHVMRNVLT